jgi:hypothetical protein
LNDLNYWLSPKAIRNSAQKIFDEAKNGKTHFSVDESKLEATAEYVLKVIHSNYPDLNIPFHSRWGHFRPGGVDRSLWLNDSLPSDKMERARIKLDLVITSVLLDAGAGAEWKYFEEKTDKHYNRSEGLGVASFHMFMSKIMSGDETLKATSRGLKNLKPTDIEEHFQVTPKNPLVGVEGRTKLLNNLGSALENTNIFKDNRPGNIIDYLVQKHGHEVDAKDLLRAVLDGLGPIWPGRVKLDGVNLGDVWTHSQYGMMAFHKLSQWMTYSLVEPIEEAGIKITGADQLTGLAEYRNGGLMLDSGLIEARNSKDMTIPHHPESDLIIEWRALTVYFLDLISTLVQKSLNKSPAEFPLAKVLEGGTWWAGRKIALEKRVGGVPPLNIISDGTVF